MSIEVSVIMISYNKYPLNLFSLYALENQTFDKNKMEVIFVDDASTDETSLLQNYQFPFRFNYVHCTKNEGRSRTKNIGVKNAKGKILIFLDTEIILDPDFIQQHFDMHQREDNLVITGCSQHYDTFTVLNKNFNNRQLRKYYRVLQKIDGDHIPKNWRLFRRHLKRRLAREEKIMLLTKNCIRELKYKKYSYPTPFYPQVIKRFGTDYEGYKMPWMFVITHNISLKRSLFDAVGPFYEEFDGYGCEDWEFGYRLYKYGAKIMDNPNVKIYHQEHPRSLGNQYKDSLKNYLIFFQRHRNFDVGVHSLCWIGKNFLDVNDLIIEYDAFQKEYPEKFKHLKQGFNHFFEIILTLLLNDQPVTKLLDESSLYANSKWRNGLIQEIKTLKSTGKFPKLTNTMVWIFYTANVDVMGLN